MPRKTNSGKYFKRWNKTIKGEIKMESKMFNILKEWRTAVNEKVTMKPESEYIHWFISLVERTNEIINEYEEGEEDVN